MAARKKTQANGNMHLKTVSLDKLYAHPENDYSFESDALEELLESIRREGMAQPPLVRKWKDGFQIISGHRRVMCCRRLAEEDPEYSAIPVNVIDDCDDERALVLLDVSNLMVRQLSVFERAKRFERLWRTVPQLREKHPELKGVRTSQVIADIVTRETGQSVSRATIDRALAAGKKAREVNELAEAYSDSLIDAWVSELKTREGFTPNVVKDLATRDESVQKQLMAEYQNKNMTPKQLEKALFHESVKTDLDIERSLDQVINILRDVSAWHKKDGAALDMYRVNYIRKQLDRLIKQ